GDGMVRGAGTDRAISFAELGRWRPGRRRALSVEDAFAPTEATYPNGTRLAEVEIDPDTGAVGIVSYLVVDDFGATLNPLLLAGQVHGGTVQGIGQALLERAVYDTASGQLVSASLMDYALPRAQDVPALGFETRNVPCRTNPLGVKGAGEAGAIRPPPAGVNAGPGALLRPHPPPPLRHPPPPPPPSPPTPPPPPL